VLTIFQYAIERVLAMVAQPIALNPIMGRYAWFFTLAHQAKVIS
jgi:hypothetical protein